MPLDVLTAQVARNPLEFFRQTTVNPPGGDARYRRRQPIALGPPELRFFSNRQAIVQNQRQYTSGQIEPQVAWIRFGRDPMFAEGVTFDVEYAAPQLNPRDYTDVSNDFEQRVAASARLPVWYLPWDPDHLVRLTIPRYRDENVRDFGGGVEVDPYNPHLFFTAGLTGCSVFAYGDPRNPTVVHAGTQAPTPYGDDSAGFWREILTAERFQRLQHVGLAHEVNLDDYMGNTPNLARFHNWLQQQPQRFTVEHTITSGSVFGIRYGALWTFYLQENVWVARYRMERQRRRRTVQTGGLLGFFTTPVTEEWDVDVRVNHDTTRPISVRPFFPHGGHARFWETFQRSYR